MSTRNTKPSSFRMSSRRMSSRPRRLKYSSLSSSRGPSVSARLRRTKTPNRCPRRNSARARRACPCPARSGKQAAHWHRAARRIPAANAAERPRPRHGCIHPRDRKRHAGSPPPRRGPRCRAMRCAASRAGATRAAGAGHHQMWMRTRYVVRSRRWPEVKRRIRRAPRTNQETADPASMRMRRIRWRRRSAAVAARRFGRSRVGRREGRHGRGALPPALDRSRAILRVRIRDGIAMGAARRAAALANRHQEQCAETATGHCRPTARG